MRIRDKRVNDIHAEKRRDRSKSVTSVHWIRYTKLHRDRGFTILLGIQ